jgi:hypothetical protein
MVPFFRLLRPVLRDRPSFGSRAVRPTASFWFRRPVLFVRLSYGRHAAVADVLTGQLWTGDCGPALDRVLGGISGRRTARCSVNIVRSWNRESVRDVLGHPLVVSGLEDGAIVLIATSTAALRDRLADALEQPRCSRSGRAGRSTLVAAAVARRPNLEASP